MICEKGEHKMQGEYCLKCGWLFKYIETEQQVKSEFVQVKKEDLEFIFSQLGKLDEYQNYEKQKEFKSKYLGEEGG